MGLDGCKLNSELWVCVCKPLKAEPGLWEYFLPRNDPCQAVPGGIWAGIPALCDHPLPFLLPGRWEAGKAFLDYLLGVVLGSGPGLEELGKDIQTKQRLVRDGIRKKT